MYIDGEWVNGTVHFKTLNPSTAKDFGFVCQSQKRDIDNAVKSARNSLKMWSETPIEGRAKILSNLSALLIEEYGNPGEQTPLKRLIQDEMGKRLPEADIEVVESSDFVSYFANQGPALLKPRTPLLNQELWPTKKSTIYFEPMGVVGVIKPWNYPLELPIWTIAPALLAGNTVVFKPSEKASFVAIELGRLFERAGLPPGVLNILTGDSMVGRSLVAHDGIDMISFTGSVMAGKEIAVECAKRLRKCTLELGGNDAAIILNNADLELTTNGLVWGAFCNSGQICVRTKRVFVVEEVSENLTTMIVAKTKALRPGVDYGPIVSERQLATVEEYLEDAVSQGAQVLTGGKRIISEGGYYFEPTVLTQLTPSMRLMNEECFGPVLPIISVPNIDAALEMANDSKYGLGGSVWTRDLENGISIAKSMEVGMAWVNDVNVAFAEAPWSGTKQSGMGVELGEFGIFEYVRPKHISVETSNQTTRDWWYPY